MGNIGAWCRIIGIVTVLAFVLKYCARATHIAGWANIYVKLFIWLDIYHISYSCIYYLSSAKSYLVLLCSFQLGKEERICVVCRKLKQINVISKLATLYSHSAAEVLAVS